MEYDQTIALNLCETPIQLIRYRNICSCKTKDSDIISSSVLRILIGCFIIKKYNKKKKKKTK